MEIVIIVTIGLAMAAIITYCDVTIAKNHNKMHINLIDMQAEIAKTCQIIFNFEILEIQSIEDNALAIKKCESLRMKWIVEQFTYANPGLSEWPACDAISRHIKMLDDIKSKLEMDKDGE